MREGLNRLYGQQRLGGIARGGGDPILIFAAQAAQAPPQCDNRDQDARHQKQNKSRQLGRCQKHQNKPAKKDQTVS